MQRAKFHIPVHHLRRAALALSCLLLVPLHGLEAAPSPDSTMRFGFSHTLFDEIKENEAMAAIKVLARTVARQRNNPVNPLAMLFSSTEEISTALENKTVDMVAVSILEYEMLQRQFSFGIILFPTKNEEVGEECLLVVQKEGPVQSLADLAGRHILLYQNIFQCLAPLWLDTLLIERGLAPTDSLTGKVAYNGNLLQVLLPVFFKQVDACVVNRRSLETAIEMNPQLGRQLTVLQSSPRMVPVVFAFRQGYSPTFKEDLLETLRTLHETEEGRQILMVFKINQFTEHSKFILETALNLISSHSRRINN